MVDELPGSNGGQIVRVNIEGIESTLAQYVNLAQSTFDGMMFHVTLAQAIAIPITNAEELQAAQAKGIEGRIISKVLMAPDFMRTIIESFQEGLRQQEEAGTITARIQTDAD